MCCIILTVALNVVAGSENPLVEPARKEGKALFYADITGIEPIMQAFQQYRLSSKPDDWQLTYSRRPCLYYRF